MKKFWIVSLIAVLSLSLALAGCGGGGQESAGNNEDNANGQKDDAPKEEPAAKKLSGDITVWTFTDDTGFVVESFNKKYPDVKVNIVKMDYGEMHDKTLTAIAAGSEGPDAVMIERGRFAEFKNIGGLEDLLKPPYNAGRYKGDYTTELFEQYFSLDGKQMLGLPFGNPPGVTFYRADIMEENGFPSDPEELAVFMEDPDNFLSIARSLKAKDKYVIEYDTSMIGWMTGNVAFFDRDLNYVRNNDAFVKALDIAKEIKQLELASNLSIWSDEGKQATNTGKLAMFFSGAWHMMSLPDMSPDNAGKWRATRLPFGNYAVSGGSTLSILSQSKNKEAAWAYIEHTLASVEGQADLIKNNIMPGFKPAWELPEFNIEDEYLGGQPANTLFAALMEKNVARVESTLDGIAGNIWNEGIAKVLEQNNDSRASLQQIADDIEKAVALERDKLKQIITSSQ